MYAINTENAPAAVGPYSQGTMAARTVYVSGQLPIDPKTGKFVEGDIAAQTEQSIKNIQAILATQDLTLSDVVKTTIFITDMADFKEVNRVYGEYFTSPCPARSCIQVSALPLDGRVEIECIASK